MYLDSDNKFQVMYTQNFRFEHGTSPRQTGQGLHWESATFVHNVVKSVEWLTLGDISMKSSKIDTP